MASTARRPPAMRRRNPVRSPVAHFSDRSGVTALMTETATTA